MEKTKKRLYNAQMMSEKKKRKNERLMKLASIASVLTAVFLIVAKLIAYLFTHSVSILSSLFDSCQDLLTSAVNFIAVKQAIEPPDKQHRFGHGKAQALGGLIQAFIILIASLFLLSESISRFMDPTPLARINIGIWVTVIAIIGTISLVLFQSYVIKKTGSLSIKADQAHYTGDILMNVGVIISMIASHYWQLYWIDSLFGIGVSLYLLFVVYQVSHESFDMLMDHELPDSFRRGIKDIVLSYPEVINIRDLKTRSSGDSVFIQLTVEMDEQLTLKSAHNLTEYIENGIREKYPNADILIHPEPYLKENKNDSR